MALPNMKPIELQYLNQWFSTLVSSINFDLEKIEGAVIARDKELTNIDTAPLEYLKDSLNELVDNMNNGFEQIDDQFRSLDGRMKAVEAKNGVV